jgi:hypothetical protein
MRKVSDDKFLSHNMITNFQASKGLQSGTAKFHADASKIATTWSVSNRTTQLSSPKHGTSSFPACPHLIKLNSNLLPTTSLTLSMAQSRQEDPTNKSLKWLLKSKIVRQRFLGVHQMWIKFSLESGVTWRNYKTVKAARLKNNILRNKHRVE